MGQSIGKARIAAEASPVIGLTWQKVEQLHKRSTGERLAHTFALDVSQLQYVAGKGMQDTNLNVTEASDLLDLFDPEAYGVADRFEVVCVAVICSMLNEEQKVKSLFEIFDFECNGTASFDAVLLAITSAISGLSKMTEVLEDTTDEERTSASAIPPEKMIESLVQNMFTASNVKISQDLPREAFQRYCLMNPIIQSWMSHFDAVTPGDHTQQQTQMLRHSYTRPCLDSMQRPFLLERHLLYKQLSLALILPKRKDRDVLCRKLLDQKWKRDLESQLSSASQHTGSTPHVRVPARLELEWAHGYVPSQPGQQNIFYSDRGDVVYPVAAVVALLQPLKRIQTFYRGHKLTVRCLAAHSNGTLFASADSGKDPVIRIWDVHTLTCQVYLEGFFQYDVDILNFSPNGRLLLAVGKDAEGHSHVALYRWATGQLVYSLQTDFSVSDARFHTDAHFAICGNTDMLFAQILQQQLGNPKVRYARVEGRQRRQRGKGAGNEPLSAMELRNSTNERRGLHVQLKKGHYVGVHLEGELVCIGFVGLPNGGQILVTGSSEGYIYTWEGRCCTGREMAHEGGVNVIDSSVRGLATGGNDGKVKLWTANVLLVATFDMQFCGTDDKHICSVVWSTNGQKLLVGTREGKVFELSGITGSNTSTGPLATCHNRTFSNTHSNSDTNSNSNPDSPSPTSTKHRLGGEKEQQKQEVEGEEEEEEEEGEERSAGVIDKVIVGLEGNMSLAVCPSATRSEVCTVGNDGQVFIWDLDLQQSTQVPSLDHVESTKVPLSSRMNYPKVPLSARTDKNLSPTPLSKCCYSPDGESILLATRKPRRPHIPPPPPPVDELNTDIAEAPPVLDSINSLILLRRGTDDGVSDTWTQMWSTPLAAGGDHAVCDMCFSPLGRRIAFGCTNGLVYVIDSKKYQKVMGLCEPSWMEHVTQTHIVSVSHVQFYVFHGMPSSERYLQVNYETLDGTFSSVSFYDLLTRQPKQKSHFTCLNNALQNTLLSDFSRDMKHYRAPFDIGMQGLYSVADAALSRRIRSVDTCVVGASDDTVVVVGDNLGGVRIHEFPCETSLNPFNSYKAHSCDVAVVRFNAHGDRVISCSGNDEPCLLVWKLIPDGNDSIKDRVDPLSSAVESDSVDDDDEDEDGYDMDIVGNGKRMDANIRDSISGGGLDGDDIERMDARDVSGGKKKNNNSNDTENDNSSVVVVEENILNEEEEEMAERAVVRYNFHLCALEAGGALWMKQDANETEMSNYRAQGIGTTPCLTTTPPLTWVKPGFLKSNKNSDESIPAAPDELSQAEIGGEPAHDDNQVEKTDASKDKTMNNHDAKKVVLHDSNTSFLASEACAKQVTTPANLTLPIPDKDINRLRAKYLIDPLISDQPFTGPVLERVLGFTCRYGTNTARFAGTAELTTVHTAASVVVVQNHETNQQRFMGLHTDHVVSLSVAPDGLTVASAQIGIDACVLVWNAESMCVTRVFRGLFCGAVTRLSFSPCSRYLAVTGFEALKTPGAMNSQSTAIVDVSNGVVLSKTHRGVPHASRTERSDLVFAIDGEKANVSSSVDVSGKILAVEFVPSPSGLIIPPERICFVECGVGALTWNKCSNDGMKTLDVVDKWMTQPSLSGVGKRTDLCVETMTCVAWLPCLNSDNDENTGFSVNTSNQHDTSSQEMSTVALEFDAVIGTSSGKLMRFRGAQCSTQIADAHPGPILAARTLYGASTFDSKNRASADAIVTAGSDGHVTLWGANLARLWSCRLAELDISMVRPFSMVVSLDARWYTEEDVEVEVLLGTDAGQIVLVNAIREEVIQEEQTQPSISSALPIPPAYKWITSGEVLVSAHSQIARELDSTSSACAPGHFKLPNQVLALAVHPTRAEATSGCSNGQLFVWDLESFELLQVTTPEINSAGRIQVGQITACSYSNDGVFLAVGFGQCISEEGDDAFVPDSSDIEGDVAIYQAIDLELVKVVVMPTGAITCLQFSKNDAILACASRDGDVYTFDAKRSFSPMSSFSKHQSIPSHLDFCEDNEILRSCSADPWSTKNNANEIRFSDGISGNEIPTADAVRDKDWQTFSIPIEWCFWGAWTHGRQVVTTDVSKDRSLAVCGNLWGGVELTRFPRLSVSEPEMRAVSHVGPVSRVFFTADDQLVVSSGVDDCCIMVWRIKPAVEKSGEANGVNQTSIYDGVENGSGANGGGNVNDTTGADADDGVSISASIDSAAVDDTVRNSVASIVEEEEEKRGQVEVKEQINDNTQVSGPAPKLIASRSDLRLDHILYFTASPLNTAKWSKCNKSTNGSLRTDSLRTGFKIPTGTFPQQAVTGLFVQLRHVYGCQDEHSLTSLYYSQSDKLVYHVGAVGVVYDKDEHRQSFFTGHQVQITSMVMSSDLDLIVTADIGVSGDPTQSGKVDGDDFSNPNNNSSSTPSEPTNGQEGGTIRCWRVGSRRELRCFPSFHHGAIVSLAMSIDGCSIVSVGMGPLGHVVALWKDAHGGSEWTRPCVVASSLCGHSRVLFITFDNSIDGQLCFVTGNTAGDVVRWTTSSTAISLLGVRLSGASEATRDVQRHGTRERVIVGVHICAATLHSTSSNNNKKSQAGYGRGVVTGTTNGQLCVWVAGKFRKRVVDAHKGSVLTLACKWLELDLATVVVSGGQDGIVKMWSTQLEPLWSVNIARTLQHTGVVKATVAMTSITSVDVDRYGVKLVVSMRSGQVCEVVRSSKQILQVIAPTHTHGALGDIACSPTEPTVFASVGDDGWVRLWDASTLRGMRACPLEMPGRALAFSPSGEELVVGFGMTMPIPTGSLGGTDVGMGGTKVGSSVNGVSQHMGAVIASDVGDEGFDDDDDDFVVEVDAARVGNLVVLSTQTLEVLHEGKSSEKSVLAMRFAPDRSSLAVVTDDGSINIHGTSDSYEVRSRAKLSDDTNRRAGDVHFAGVVEVDYSSDGTLIRCTRSGSGSKKAVNDINQDTIVNTDDNDRVTMLSLPSCNVLDREAKKKNLGHGLTQFVNARCAINSNGEWDISASAFAEHYNRVTCATTSAVAWGNTIVVRRVQPEEQGSNLEMIQLPVVHGFGVQRLVFSPDGSVLFSIGVASRLVVQWQVWN